MTIRTLADIPRRFAEDRPDHTALIDGDRRTSYAEFNRLTNRVANGLRDEGLKPGARIAYLGKNEDSFFEILMGAAKANMTVVPVNWRLAPPEVGYILNDAMAEAVFVGEEFYPLVEKNEPALKSLRCAFALGATHPRYRDYRAWRDRQAAADPHVPVDPEDVVIQMYTSGTTGHPKGARLPHRGLVAVRRSEAQIDDGWARWREDEVNLVVSPIFHIAGTNSGVAGLYNGAVNVIVRDFETGAVLDIMQQHRPSRMLMVPSAIKLLIEDPKCAETDFSSFDYILYGASPIPLDLLKRAIATFGCGFVQLYGMTEACGRATYLPPADHDAAGNARMRSAGIPFPGMTVKVLGEDGKALGPGAVGEICVKSPGLMKGYWNLPEATAKAIKDGWLHTGDAGYVDDAGYVFVHDRLKDMIVSGGENVYPAEVESAIFGHPALADVAVIGVPDPKWGEAVMAFCVLKPGMEASEEEIIAFARARIAGFKAPKSVAFVDALPRNPSGKLLKRELRAPFWEAHERQVN